MAGDNKRKVAVVITSRASCARIKSAIAAIRQGKKLELQLVVGASALLERRFVGRLEGIR